MNKAGFYLAAVITFLQITSCGFFGFDRNSLRITKDFIEKTDGEPLVSFTIAVYERDSVFWDTRPLNKTELVRYCCSIKDSTNCSSKVYFNEERDGYYWSRCDLVLDFVENDSLKNLSTEEKLSRIEFGSIEYFDVMPFKFERSKIYHLFGIQEMKGSYYLTIDASGELIVDYFDGGPM